MTPAPTLWNRPWHTRLHELAQALCPDGGEMSFEPAKAARMRVAASPPGSWLRRSRTRTPVHPPVA